MLLGKGTVKYYRVSGVDNNACFYGDDKELLKFCSKCKLIVNRYEAAMAAAETFVLKKGCDYSSCWDGETVVLQRFVDIYNKYSLSGLSFIKLPRSKNFYLLQCHIEVRYDYGNNPNLVRRQLCTECGQYREVSCVLPIKILDEDRLKNNTFYKTDLIVGGVVGRWPLLLATDDIPHIFQAEKIKDIYFKLCNKNG